MEYPIISEIICTTSTEYASHWLQLEVLALPLQSRSRRELSHRLTGDIGRVKPTIIGGYLWKLGKLTNSVPDNVRSSIWRFWAYPQAKFIITSGLGILTKKKIEVMQRVGILMPNQLRLGNGLIYRVSQKNARLRLEAYNSSLEAAIGTCRDIFRILRFSAFIWAQEVQDCFIVSNYWFQ